MLRVSHFNLYSLEWGERGVLVLPYPFPSFTFQFQLSKVDIVRTIIYNSIYDLFTSHDPQGSRSDYKPLFITGI